MSSSSSSGNAGITLKAEITFRSYGPITDSPGTPYYCADWDNQAGMLAYSPAGGGHGEQWVGTAGPATLTYFLGVAGDAFLRFETGACGQGTYSILLSSTPTDAYCGLFIVNLTGNCCSTPAYDFTLEIRIFNPNGACPTPPVCAKCLAASQAPVRYATGELSLSAADFQSNGFGIPWGHTRSFSSRLTTPVNLGNGWNWQIREWTYLILDNLRRGTTSITTAVLMGEAGQTV
ncbi:MAG: hypothetical protein HY290_07420, partial [Planctomycetia bacterium]|nr:hypothetical protein [Planctomycetia bacterium]